MRQLTMSTEDGTPYTRSPAVEEQIAETLCCSDSDLPAKRKSLLNEVLVYNIRRFRERDDQRAYQKSLLGRDGAFHLVSRSNPEPSHPWRGPNL